MAFTATSTDQAQKAESTEILIVRNSGWFGKFVRLHVLCNGRTVAKLGENEQAAIQVSPSEMPASIQVKMQSWVGSPVMKLESSTEPIRLECGARAWTLLDGIGLYLLPGLRDEVFYLTHFKESE